MSFDPNRIDWSQAPEGANSWRYHAPTGKGWPAMAFWLVSENGHPPVCLDFAPTFDCESDKRQDWTKGEDEPDMYHKGCKVSFADPGRPLTLPQARLTPRKLVLLPHPYETAEMSWLGDRLLIVAAGQPPAFLNEDGSIEVRIPPRSLS